MTLSPGTHVGHFEILSPIGTGGMGVVYRARDTSLKRDVAIKVLPEEFTRDRQRLSRFQREAEVLASLNHPNIAGIYNVQEVRGSRILVLELIEGETLGDRINHKALPIEEALRIAKQIAEALGAAHDKGVIHRDLKPANIMVTKAGTVKVLDFGLAKVVDPESADANPLNSPTQMSASRTGIVLGTAAYMSPEQARGKPIDKRTDVWAFAAILFEMLTGRQAFAGETVSDTIVSVLTREVDWSALPPRLPSRIHDLLRRCLQRDMAQRLRDIGDARIEIAEVLAGVSTWPLPEIGRGGRRWPSILTLPALVAAVLMGVLVGFVAFTLLMPSRDAPSSWTGSLLGGPPVAQGPRISPDGKTLAFQAVDNGLSQVAIMSPQSGQWIPLTKDRTRGYVSTISWSRDSERIYYTRYDALPRGIYSVAALGGEERLVLENASGAEPLPDGSLLVARINNASGQTQIYRYRPGVDRLDPLPGILTDNENVRLRVFPDGSRAVFWGKSLDQPAPDSRNYLYLLDLTSGKTSRVRAESDLSTQVTSLAVTPDGKSVLVSGPNGDLRKVVAIPLDASGTAQTLINTQDEVKHLEMGPDGSLYVDQVRRPVEIVRFAASDGTVQRVSALPNVSMGIQPKSVLYLPDGRTLIPAFVGGRNRLLVSAPGKEPATFIDIDEETSSPAASVGNDRVAFIIGSGDARQIALASLRDSRILRRLQGVRISNIRILVSSPDGATLYYVDAETLWSVPTDGGEPRKIRRGDGVAVSPDGKSLFIQLLEAEDVRYVKLDLDTGMEQPVVVKSEFPFNRYPPAPGAVASDGRIVLSVAVRDSWYWPPAIFDPNTASVRRIPVPYDGDLFFPAWTPDGNIIATGNPYVSSIWRYRPVQN